MIKKILNLDALSKILLLVPVFLVPMIFYPNNLHFLGNIKLGLFFGSVLLMLILWSISRLKKNDFKIPMNLMSLSIVLILIVSLASSVFSDNPLISVFGHILTPSSFSGLFILFASSLVIASLFKKEKDSLILGITVYTSLVVTLFFNLVYILFNIPNFGFFVANSVNTIGKWTDLGVLAALTLIISYLIIETHTNKKLLKGFAWFGLGVSTLIVLIVSEVVIWILIGIISILYLVYKIVSSRQESDDSVNKDLPYTAITAILISFVMILAGGLISNFSDSWLKISFEETKPGISATFDLTKNTLQEQPILGVGINRFEKAWQVYKPDYINLTNHWGTDFVYGYSYLTSIPAQSGVLGGLAWLLLIVAVVMSAIKLLFKKTTSVVSQNINLISSISILFFVLALFVQVPSVTLIILFFVSLGLFIGSLDRVGLYKGITISIKSNPKFGFLYIFSIILLMILSIYLGYMSARQFSATIFIENANHSISIGELDKTQANIVNSINVYTTDVNLRALSEFYLIQIQQLLSNKELDEETTAEAFRGLLTNSISASGAAINFDSNNYMNHISLAGIYEQLISLEIEGSYDQSIAVYEEAIKVSPKNPGIYIDMARVSFVAKKNDVAREYLSKALEIKPQFVEAAFLLSQIQVAEGDIDEAIRSVELSINIQPNNSNLYFQLGLLKFNQKNYKGSVSAFEKAVILNRVFANAKYFLGLSYDKVGRTDDAIAQFEDVILLNPNNKEVQKIIDNLESGVSAVDEGQDLIEDEDDLPVEESIENEE